MNGGNALDRAKAGSCIGQVESNLGRFCIMLRDVAAKVKTVNEGYKGAAHTASISLIYYRYYETIEACMKNFGSGFIETNNNLVKQINNGADGDDVHPTIEDHTVSFDKQILNDANYAGVVSFSRTQGEIEALSSSINELITQTDQIISGYKNLWNEASSHNNQNLAKSANQAADVVRQFVNQLQEGFSKANKDFITVITNQANASDADSVTAMEAVDAMQASLNSIDFGTLTVEMESTHTNTSMYETW